MDVDDMFDMMKTLEGAKPTVNNETTNKKPVQESKKYIKISTPFQDKEDKRDERGAKSKSNINRDQKTVGVVKPKSNINRQQIPTNQKQGKNTNVEDNVNFNNNDVDDMFNMMNTLTGTKPKSSVSIEQKNKNQLQAKNPNLRKDNKSTVDMFDMNSLDKIGKSYVDLQDIDGGPNLFTDQLGPKVMNLITLQKLCSEDISKTIFTLVDRKSGFLDIFHEQNLKTEKIFCVMNLLGKLCNSEDLRFNEIILSPACSPDFLQELQVCIGALPAEINIEIKKKIGKFFEDVFAFVNTVSIVFPMTASHRMRKILLSTQINIQNVQERLPDVLISDHVYFEIKSLWDQLNSQNVDYNNINPVGVNSKSGNTKRIDIKSVDRPPVINVKPPNYYRTISVYPTQDDLFSNVSFLRENIVVGAYADVDHYLDVQFRLYKEDFVAPLREGLQEYLKNSTTLDQSKRINNIRFYSNVRFLGSEIKGNNLGCTVEFSKAKLKNVVWSTSKRLMFGSLLMFSNDNFKSFFLATVSGRDVKQLKRGIVTVQFIASNNIPPDLFHEEFIMLESEVFFEPYFQVLTVLKRIHRYSFPMEDYIIHVKAEQRIPGEKASKSKNDVVVSDVWYLSVGEKRFNVLNDNSWPNHKELCLDSSQYKAVKAALTSAFTVIQGPPGTGKTYIGLKIASALIKKGNGPLLVICYTNHALDQFLEGLLPFTKRLVRIGGQSKSPTLKTFHITEIRRRWTEKKRLEKQSLSKKGRKYYYCTSYAIGKQRYYAAKTDLEEIKLSLLTLENEIKTLQNSILSIGFFKQHFNHKQKRMLSDRVLVDWLMEECVNSEVLDCNDIEKEVLSSGTGTEEENPIDLDKLGGAEDENSSENSSGSDTEEEREEDDSDFEILSDDNYSNFVETNEIFDSFCEDPELASYYERKRSTIKWKQLKDVTLNKEYEKILEKTNDKFVDLNFENEMRGIDKLFIRLNSVRAKLYPIQSNSNWRKIQCVRYEIIDELNYHKKYLNHNETDKLECLNVEDLNEYIEDELEQLLDSIRKKMIIEINAKKKYLKEKLSSKPVFNLDIVENFKDCSDIWVISTDDRWMLYHYWTSLYRKKLMNLWTGLQADYDNQYKHLKTVAQNLDMDFLCTMNVIGLTTTCAARLRTMLEAINPKIVIIEEAAEVFEAHIVTTLTQDCEQVVLIGDHEQLRPSPSTYKLAKKYNMDISLFERMIRNGMCCYSLEIQHRMRPEIVSLIVPAIYNKLDNHQSVLDRPDIRGMASNVYFVTHNLYENTVNDSASRRNSHEAEFLIALCMYLLYQGYSADQITILTTYTGQMYYLKEVVKKQVLAPLHSVKITVVDNYQGEENDIILLSLVRSNKESRVGFLATKNRICVALSRARDGLYIIGNMDNLTDRSTVWQEVKDQLQKQNAIGPALPLRCTVHSHNITRVSFAADFRHMHNGGCTLPCGTKLNCGHVCPELCHITNREHVYDPNITSSIRCNEIVEQMLLCGHERKLPCYLTTDDRRKCDVEIEYDLDCGHSVILLCQDNVLKYKCKELVAINLYCGHQTMLPCFQDPEGYKCMEIVLHELELCGHTVNKCCWVQKVDPWLCKVLCGMELSCGHDCEDICHQYDDPDHLKVKCMKKCTQTRKGCSLDHICRKLCYENCELCDENVQKNLPCGHVAELKCKDEVTDFFCEEYCEKILPCNHTDTICCGADVEKYFCRTICTKVLPCEHEKEMHCGEDVTNVKCVKSCSRMLKCGHKCGLLCSKPCTCYVMVTNKFPECGHELTLPCHEFTKNTRICEKPCARILPCEHPCRGLCGNPCDLIKCQEPCMKILPCGHRCKGQCAESCDLVKCQEPCTKLLDCGHSCAGKCAESCDLVKCQEPCTKLLDCGHPCTSKCEKPCHLVECEEEIVKEAKTDCGHENVLIKCSLYTKVSAESSPYLMMYFCNEPCRAELPCGHECVGRCGACMQGNLHIPCVQECTNKLVCGHMCKALCKELCPPCNQACLYSCQHGPCRKKCGEACDRCQKKCDWHCFHERCTKLCFEMCNRNPCNEPCPINLICGHPCMGFCGEVCPTLCRVCDNLDYSVDDRLVVLEDCGHAVQSSCLDEMFQFSEQNSDIVVRTCPICDCIISKTKRYRNAIRMTCRIIRHIKNKVILNLRHMNGDGAKNIKTDLALISKNEKAFSQTARLFLDYLLNLYNGQPVKVTRKKYATIFLSDLLIELSRIFFEYYKIKSESSKNLYNILTGLSLRSNPYRICDFKYILFRAECLIQKMEQRLMGMSIHDMKQFYLEVLRLKIIIHRMKIENKVNDKSCFLWETYSLEMAEEEVVKLEDMMGDLNLSVNVWTLCSVGHIILKSKLYPAKLNKDGLIQKCPICRSEKEKHKLVFNPRFIWW